MERIAPFSSESLVAACQVIADTSNGLTGTEIGHLLSQINVEDVSPSLTKWKRLYNALAEKQNQHNVGNHLVMAITRVMSPVSYDGRRDLFNSRRDRLNTVLAFSGLHLREDGKIIRVTAATTLSEAQRRANRLKQTLEERGAHMETLRYCRAELLDNNYFHAVLEAIKGISQRVRDMSNLVSDGADLVNVAFSTKNPVLAINPLKTETEVSEQKGFANMLVGLFGAVRNPLAHAPKVFWPMSEVDAVDLLTFMSYIHRKLDVTVKV